MFYISNWDWPEQQTTCLSCGSCSACWHFFQHQPSNSNEKWNQVMWKYADFPLTFFPSSLIVALGRCFQIVILDYISKSYGLFWYLKIIFHFITVLLRWYDTSIMQSLIAMPSISNRTILAFFCVSVWEKPISHQVLFGQLAQSLLYPKAKTAIVFLLRSEVSKCAQLINCSGVPESYTKCRDWYFTFITALVNVCASSMLNLGSSF